LEVRNQADAARLAYFAQAFEKTVVGLSSFPAEEEWTALLSRLADATLKVLAASPPSSARIDGLLRLLIFLSKLIPRQMAYKAEPYYQVMARLTGLLPNASISRDNLVNAILALLVPITSGTLEAYEWFARVILTLPSLDGQLGNLNRLANDINYKLLASALDASVLTHGEFLHSTDVNGRLWLLAYFIFFHRSAFGDRAATQAPELLFVKVVSALLSSTSAEICRRVDTELPDQRKSAMHAPPLPLFVQTQILSLINQTSITHLLSHAGPDNVSNLAEDAKSLATYGLTLLRVFPRRADEIRMWLYLGSTETSSGSQTRLPALKYFWNASRTTRVYRRIVGSPNDILGLLRPSSKDRNTANPTWRDHEQEWTVILLFLELYTFLLKVLDDEEFFSGGYSSPTVVATQMSRTKESTLPLGDVKDLTIFLKNLAFTLYWNAADLNAPDTTHTSASLSDYFNATTTAREPTPAPKTKSTHLVFGIPFDYLKGLVTGLLRMVHERE
jgi:ubiquitin-protein ligase E3 C